MLGNGNQVVDRAGRGARGRSCPSTTPTSSSPATGRGRRAGPQDRVPVLDQPGRHRPRPGTWPSATPTTATRSGRSPSGEAGSAPTCSTRCASRSCGRPPSPIRTASRRRSGWSPRTPRAGRGRHRAARAGGGRHAAGRPRRTCAAARRRLPRARRAAHRRRGGRRLRPHRDPVRQRAVRHPARPALPGQGPHRRLPADVGHRGLGPGVRRLPRARTSPSGRCTTGIPTAGTPLAAAVALRHLQLVDEWRRAGRRPRPRPPSCAGRAGRARSPRSTRSARSASTASWSAWSCPTGRGPALGSTGLRRSGRTGCPAAPAG